MGNAEGNRPERRTIRFAYWPLARDENARPLATVDHQIVVVPEASDSYWHEGRGYRVFGVTEGDAPLVHFEPDDERTEAFYAQLPEGVIIDAGRNGDTGEWHAEVHESEAARANRLHPLGWSAYVHDCDTAISQAVGQALEVLRARG